MSVAISELSSAKEISSGGVRLRILVLYYKFSEINYYIIGVIRIFIFTLLFGNIIIVFLLELLLEAWDVYVLFASKFRPELSFGIILLFLNIFL